VRAAARGRDQALGDHAFEPVHIQDVHGERDGARVGDPRGAIPAHESEQGVDAAHARPGQGTIEQRRRVAANHGPGLLRLPPQRIDVA
jgi:hypothetical protein